MATHGPGQSRIERLLGPSEPMPMPWVESQPSPEARHRSHLLDVSIKVDELAGLIDDLRGTGPNDFANLALEGLANDLKRATGHARNLRESLSLVRPRVPRD